jgi:threonine aldolase
VSPRRGFASDNAAGVHPAVLAALAAVNEGHAFGYGHDPYSASVAERVAAELGGREAYFVFNGSGANVVGLRACCRPWEGVLCSDWAHVNTDEGGAPEVIGGLKLLSVPSLDGKITPEAVEPLLWRGGDEHSVQPRVLTVTQATEFGTVYSLEELRALASFCHERELLLHIDGARLANAAASLGCSLRELVSGADVVSFGGTKNGLLGAEAIVVLNESLLSGMLWLRKQSLQLASKMRFLAAQFDALLTDELWLRNASAANAAAARLAGAVSGIPGVSLTRPVQANALFAVLPRAAVDVLLREFDFYWWDEPAGEVRWMCSWDTAESDVDEFAAAVRDAVYAAA